jgi:Na+/H+-dicarboxylate symporter
VPVEILALLIAVDVLPDMVATTGNVSMNAAVTTVISKRFAPDADLQMQERRF